MKLYLDESVSIVLADILTQMGLDCQTTRDAHMLGAADADQLRYATQANRAIFSHDIKDFLRLSEQWLITGQVHAGILLSRQAPLSKLTPRFEAFLRVPLDLHNQVRWLPYHQSK